MSISSLHILSKNTDATASLKGYEYQVLKTLEAWLQSRLNKADEHIYCDYEEDVFRHNLLAHKAHFKQMKLYSKNFSFASEEVKKALAHFFMLYVKGEYTFDELEFVFESNSDIAQRRGGNNADLLREWYENQDNLSSELLGKIVPVVREVLDKYVEDRIAEPKSDEKPAMQKAAEDFKKLTDDDIAAFVLKIKWSFSDLEPDEALVQVRENVKLLAQSLPVDGAKENVGMLLSRLHYEVWGRATQTKVEDKVLTDTLLDKLVLQIGSEEDREYESIYNRWEHAEVTHFLPGEFYEIVDASEFCRSKRYLTGQDHVWKRLLGAYLKLEGLPARISRKAIYELCLLSLRNDFESFEPEGTLNGLEPEIRAYFADGDFTVDEIANAFTLLTMVSTVALSGLVEITPEEIAEWSSALDKNIDAMLEAMKHPGDKCTLLEVRGHFNYIKNGFDAQSLKDDFQKIIPLLDEADTFSTLGFYDRLNLIIAQSIKLGGLHADKNIEVFQAILEEVEPLSVKREGAFKIAKRQVNLGATYLESKDPKFLLKAIEEFHKAKDNYEASESMEGYVLALMNIGQVYMAAEMLFAGKYYVLCAIWRIVQTNRPELDKRLADAMTLLIHADFSAGAWLSVLDDFLPYLDFHIKFKTPERGPFDDMRLQKVLNLVAITIACGPVIEPSLTDHFNRRIERLGWIYDETLKADVEHHRSILKEPEYMKRAAGILLVDSPLSDLGARRKITFYALGTKWTVEFNNDFKTNAAGQQFCSILQIALTELASTDFDFNLLIAPVKIHLVLSDQKSSPVQTPTNKEFIWKVYVQEQKSNTPQEIQEIYSRMLGNVAVLLYELSLLKQDEFFPLFTEFIDKRQVKQKTLVEHGYERIYKEVFDETRFNEANRTAFEPPQLGLDLPRPNEVLHQRTGLSNKYDHEKSLKHIKDRYEISLKHFHLTLEHYKDDYFFNAWIKELREARYLDWHICVGLMNAVLSAKANEVMATRTYKTDSAAAEGFRNLYAKSLAGKEDDNFKLIPLGTLMSNFDREMDLYKVNFLESFGLVNKPQFPNFKSVADFTSERLRFFEDDVPELSPLNDIGHNLSDVAIRGSIEGFGFFVMPKGQPPVFHFQMTNHMHAQAMADEMRKLFGSVETELQISYRGKDRVDVKVEGNNGNILTFDDLPLVDDLKSKVKSYEHGDPANSMLAPSFPDPENGKLFFAAVQQLVMLSGLVID